eukprot:364876-Chlamydomonas_euryale.AAC.4
MRRDPIGCLQGPCTRARWGFPPTTMCLRLRLRCRLPRLGLTLLLPLQHLQLRGLKLLDTSVLVLELLKLLHQQRQHLCAGCLQRLVQQERLRLLPYKSQGCLQAYRAAALACLLGGQPPRHATGRRCFRVTRPPGAPVPPALPTLLRQLPLRWQDRTFPRPLLGALCHRVVSRQPRRARPRRRLQCHARESFKPGRLSGRLGCVSNDVPAVEQLVADRRTLKLSREARLAKSECCPWHPERSAKGERWLWLYASHLVHT